MYLVEVCVRNPWPAKSSAFGLLKSGQWCEMPTKPHATPAHPTSKGETLLTIGLLAVAFVVNCAYAAHLYFPNPQEFATLDTF